jgi:Tfp pilus assembly protein PilF
MQKQGLPSAGRNDDRLTDIVAASTVALVLAALLLACSGLVLGHPGGRLAYRLLGAAAAFLLAVRLRTGDREALRRPAVVVLSAAALALAGVSAAGAVNRGVALTATLDIGAGLLLFATSATLSGRGRVSVAWTAAGLSAALGLLAVLEPLGVIRVPGPAQFPGRAGGPLRSPVMLGAMLAMLLPYLVARLIAARASARTALTAVLLGVSSAGITATFSRAGLIAAAAGCLAASLPLLRKPDLAPGFSSTAAKRLVLALLVAAVVVPTFNALARRVAPPEFEVGRAPGTSVFETSRPLSADGATSAAVRVSCWRTAGVLVRANALNGVGAGCYGIVAERHLEDMLKKLSVDLGVSYQHAYNDALETAAEMGLPGVLAFAALIAVVLRSGHARLRRTHRRVGTSAHAREAERPVWAAAFGSVVAALVAGLVSAPLHKPSVAAVFWISVGLLAGRQFPDIQAAGKSPAHGKAAPPRLRPVMLGVLLALALIMVATSLRLYVVEVDTLDAIHSHNEGNWREARAAARAATERAQHITDAWLVRAEATHIAIQEGALSKGEVEDVFLSYRMLLRTTPWNARAMGRTGSLYMIHEDAVPNASDSARVYLERCLELNPYVADAHTNLGTLEMREGNAEAAAAHFLEAAHLDTASVAPRFNLANFEAQRGDTERARALYEWVLRRNPRHYGSLMNLAILSISDGDEESARRLLQSALEAVPGDARALELLRELPQHVRGRALLSSG